MADGYASGSAASFADLYNAVHNFLTTVAGWAYSAGPGNQKLYSKNGAVARLEVIPGDGLYLDGATGISGGAATGASDFKFKIATFPGAAMTFPISYELFWNDTPEEVYLVVAYNGDKFQHMHFGRSDLAGVGGTGLWYDASVVGGNLTDPQMYMVVDRNTWSGNGALYVSNLGGVHGGFFSTGDSDSFPSGAIHCGLEGTSWKTGRGSYPGGIIGQWSAWPLMMALPSSFNEAEVLLPIHIALRREDATFTVAAVMRHARMMRIDEVSPGDVITYGGDQWKVYPLYAKNTAERDGVPWHVGAQHSGTYGIAIRYSGP